MPILTARPRGTADIIPGEVEKWQYIEESFRCICREYGYAEIRTPVFEHTELFNRSVGEATDIVEKEMYTFRDRSNRNLSLRPEGTAPIARAYLENNLFAGPLPVKLYYLGPMFRYDRPQAGRYRQFHQLGIEVFGSAGPAIDAEVMAMAVDFCRRLGLISELQVNSVGCGKCRPVLQEQLQAYFRSCLASLCKDCRQRFEQNPLRILDCKVEHCRELARRAATGLNCLCGECAVHFQAVQKHLGELNVAYEVNPCLVRGLDYYTKTAFEIIAPNVGAQSSIGGGGRYDGLIKTCGGPPTPGIGYAFGLERLLLAMKEEGTSVPGRERPDVFLVTVEKALEGEALKLLQALRQQGLAADKDYLGRSLKAQMKYAGKSGIPLVAILGGNEFEQGMIALKDMTTGNQEEIKITSLAAEVYKRCKPKIPAKRSID